MKYLNTILNVVLLIAVAFLFFREFSNGEGSESETDASASSLSVPEGIAYINSDSLLANYSMYEDMVAELEEKRTKLEKEFQNRAEGLQKEITNYQRNQPNMTIGQARAVEEDLMQKQDNLRQYQGELQQQLVNDETRMITELYQSVSDYLKDYGRQNNLQLVMTYSSGSANLLYASDTLDITKPILDGLNADYQSADAATSSQE